MYEILSGEILRLAFRLESLGTRKPHQTRGSRSGAGFQKRRNGSRGQVYGDGCVTVVEDARCRGLYTRRCPQNQTQSIEQKNQPLALESSKRELVPSALLLLVQVLLDD